MGVFTLLLLFLVSLFQHASAGYRNLAVEYVKVNKAPPTTTVPGNHTVGKTTLVNQCEYDVYFWEAGDTYQNERQQLAAGTKVTFDIKNAYDLIPSGRCVDNCGITYKFSKDDHLVGGPGGNQVQYEYSTSEGIIYYDVSFVDCAVVTGYRQGNATACPAWDLAHEIKGPAECKQMDCYASEMCIHDAQGAFYIDKPVQKWGLGEPVGACPSYDAPLELNFVLCASKGKAA